ncbi:hypothetical protein CPIN18021_0721 [Campylobacter pinnipediorum subsp. caledonicus]|uniref:Uncharacterized protein n=1 Tax=Campylobacter pinnipediorum subsp. caledonicus TaxID=1874362 RepID=A0A1S6U702_9BACT|nr:hypothetical protein [Campylobacter pinnipediorum]AQW87534.1 hypothetical protein CPIN18021_0721 [Campylobacter pinnipediorum subsp. caledonicus]OPA72324.1 hypothetical protein BB381_01880 [Campylobacter pinnipediorum subsp. caledonicus]
MKKYTLLLATLAFFAGCAKNSDMMAPKANAHMSHQHGNNVAHEHKHVTDMKKGCSMDKKCEIMKDEKMPKDHSHMHMMKGKMPKDHNHMHMMEDGKKPECGCSKSK